MAVSALLSEYSVEVITKVTDPCGGLVRTCKFLPSIAEFAEACDAAKKELAFKPVKPEQGAVVTDKNIHQCPLHLENHLGKVFVENDSPEWHAWASHTREHRLKPFARAFWNGWTFPTRWPPGWPSSLRDLKIKQTAQADSTTT